MTDHPKVTAVWTDPHAAPVVTVAPRPRGWPYAFAAALAAGALIAAAAWAAPAAAQGAACLPRSPLVTLWQERGAVRVGDGTSGPWLVETWVAPTGLWIIWQANAEGFACIIGAGRDWHPAPPKGDDA